MAYNDREKLIRMNNALRTEKKIFTVRLPVWMIEEYKKRYKKNMHHVIRVALYEYLEKDVRIV